MTPKRRTATMVLAAMLAECIAPAVPQAAPAKGTARASTCRTRSVLVVVTGPEDPGIVDFRRSASEAVARGGCFRTVDPVEGLEAGVAAGQQRVETGRRALEQGRQAFLDMRMRPAVTALQQAVDSFSSAFGHLDHPGPLVEALLTLGASKASLGDATGARKAFVGALRLRPDANVEDITTLPEAAAAFRAARGEIAAERTGSLLVDSEPPGAEVYLDGTYVGPAPYDPSRIAAGPHWVVLRKIGYERRSAMVDVPDGKSVSLLGAAATLTPSRRRPLYETAVAKLAGAGVARGSGDGVEDLKALFLCDLLMIFDPSQNGLDASLWDLETMEKVWSGRDPAAGAIPGRGAAEDLVARAIGADEARRGVAESGAATVKAKGGIASKWWFWTVLGVVLAGGVTTAAVLLSKGGSNGPKGLNQDGTGAVVVRF